MVFQADIAFALLLIALGAGYWVLMKARGQEGENLKGFGTFLGWFIIVVAFLTMLCAGYYSVRYWEEGRFAQRTAFAGERHAMAGAMMHGDIGMMPGHMGMHGDKEMHMRSGEQCPMCGRMMPEGMMHGKGEMEVEKDVEHKEHYPEMDKK